MFNKSIVIKSLFIWDYDKKTEILKKNMSRKHTFFL